MENENPVIVLVDDDIDLVDIVSRLLRDRGYTVHSFSGSEEALAHMASHVPDLVITDLMMESLDSGFAFSRRIKETPELTHVPVIIITAAGSRRGFDFRPEGPDDLEAMHIAAFLEKPVNSKQLLAKIAEVISG